MFRYPLSALVVLGFLALPFATAEDHPPLFISDNAYGLQTEPLPAQARHASPREFADRYREGSLVLDTPSRSPAELGVLAETASRLEGVARTIIAPSRPDLVVRLLKIPDKSDAAFNIRGQRGENLRRSLAGRDAAIRELVSAHEAVSSLHNQAALHTLLVSRLPQATDLAELDINHVSAGELRLLNDLLLMRLDTLSGSDGGSKAPREYGDCEAEEGAGDVGSAMEGDQTGRRCEPSDRGLLKSADWALKPFNTCVRNQGTRATSIEFALIAAIESRIVRDERRFTNLSEQHFINQTRMHWFRAPADFGEGGSSALTSGRERLIGYRFHFEDVWTFNPSYDRVTTTGPWRPAYTGSCDGYNGRHCSDTAHQGRMLCTAVNGLRYCGYDAPMPAETPIAVEGIVSIFDVTQPAISLITARRLLHASLPLVLMTAIPSSFARPGSDGYVSNVDLNEKLEGAHAMLLTGWIPNDRLPVGAPHASGGGYFIAKNSWGSCAGDAGYLYLSASWVQAHALNISIAY